MCSSTELAIVLYVCHLVQILSVRQIMYSMSSAAVYILCSVPQGSVLGSRLFILYTADLADIVNEHNPYCICAVVAMKRRQS